MWKGGTIADMGPPFCIKSADDEFCILETAGK